jgi:hypothetical protein
LKKEKFPHSELQYRLEYKDGNDKKICFFSCSEHMMKHVNRYKITDFIAEHPIEGEIKFEQPKKQTRKSKSNVGFSSIEQFFK